MSEDKRPPLSTRQTQLLKKMHQETTLKRRVRIHRQIEITPERLRQELFRIGQNEDVDPADRVKALMEIRLIDEAQRVNKPAGEGAGFTFAIDMEQAARAEENLKEFQRREAARELLEQAQALAGPEKEPEIARPVEPEPIVEGPLTPEPIYKSANSLQYEIARKLTTEEKQVAAKDWVTSRITACGEVGCSYSRYNEEQRRIQ